jgi:hypothetical protein
VCGLDQDGRASEAVGFVAIGKELVEGLSLDKETVAWARYKYKETMERARGILHGRARGNCTLAGDFLIGAGKHGNHGRPSHMAPRGRR